MRMEGARRVLQSTFGFDQFRDGQEAVVGRLLEGRSVLAVFPTGGGKSLCYQLPALVLDGLTVVVSPLIALMKDQLDFLRRHGVAAARLDSSLAPSELRKVHEDLRCGKLKLLYIAPERLANERFLATLRRLKVSMLAVDEAHCISEWGHNFRPDYLKLAGLARELGVARVLALTATATPEVATDVARSFGVNDADVVRTDFHRANLFLRVTPCRDEERLPLLMSRLRERGRGSTIVYVTLQKTTEAVCAKLAAAGFPARAYHAGLDAQVRHDVQDWFMSSDEAIVVATIAFGMGVDKANIRAVYHFNLPKGLESYAQEIGRAGRDGQPATCEMLACPEDVVTLENFSCGDTPTREAVSRFLHEVLSPEDSGGEESFALSIYDQSVRHDIRPLVLETLLTYLEMEGYLQSTGPFYTEYKFQYLRPVSEILERYDASRRSFLERLFGAATAGRTWLKVDPEAAAAALGEPRQRLVAALGYLKEQGDLSVQVAGARLGYRRRGGKPDVALLVGRLTTKFQEREERDVRRLSRVLDLAAQRRCITGELLGYFGERLGDCGHCGWCAGERQSSLPLPQRIQASETQRGLVEGLIQESHAALASARQLTRFLCGLTSPATTRSRLTRDPRFGALEKMHFRDVLALVEETRGTAPVRP